MKSRAPKNPSGTMPLRDHLVELRNRLLWASIAVILGAVGGWFLYDDVLRLLTSPLVEMSHQRKVMISPNFSSVAAAFDFQVKISVFIGIFISSPFWLYQLWAFITPGLTRKERRYALGFIGSAVPLFFGGAYLAFLAIPNAVRFLVGFTPEGFSNVIEASVYLTFVMQIIMAFGLSFLLPVVLVALNFVGLLSARRMLKGWRWVVVLSFTFAAIATPTPDVLSMFLLALPLLLLFFVAIGICAVNDRMRARRAPDYSGLSDDQASPL